MSFDLANLRLRIISAAILAPLCLFAVYRGGAVFGGVIAFATAAAMFEWIKLIDPLPSKKILVAAISGLLAVELLAQCHADRPTEAVILCALLAAALFFWQVVQGYCKNKAFWIAFGLPYLALSGSALIVARATPLLGAGYVVYVLLVVWGTDIGAYIAGRLIGGPKLAPSISPKKTWAGLAGGVVLASFCGYGAALIYDAHRPFVAAALAAVLAITAQAGDLFKSYFKRRAGVKDSGQLIPGHGGMLDRIDGLVFAAIFFVAFQDTIGASLAIW